MHELHYFWYSEKQSQLTPGNLFVRIGDTEHVYTECSSHKEYRPNFNDSVFVGEGTLETARADEKRHKYNMELISGGMRLTTILITERCS